MNCVRLIARLDIKGENLIKGIHLEGLRKLGKPEDFAKRYYDSGIDEILYMDAVASLYQRNSLVEIVKRTTRNVFIPITVGGGVRSVDDARELLRAGADKVALNTAAIRRPALITELAEQFGSQCVVVSIEAKRCPGHNGWEAFTDNGREHTGFDVVEWARRSRACGAGELLVTSVDNEGTRKGFDLELVRAIAETVDIPVIASGGMGSAQHFVDAVVSGHADAVAMADVLHYSRVTPAQIRDLARREGVPVRVQ